MDAAPDFSRQKRNPVLVEAAIALSENRLHDAEPLLRQHLRADPLDVAAIRMMAELAARIGRLKDSENLLRRALDLSPQFVAARSNLATILYRQNRPADAVAELDALLDHDPDNTANASLKAAALGRIGEYDEAIALYAQVLERMPDHPKVWMSYGHLLKTVGQQAQSVAAYRSALAVAPTLGEVWWSLANLKTVHFDDADMAAMEAALATPDLDPEDRFHLHFALGKAHEDRKQAAEAFQHYDEGNRLRRANLPYDADDTSAEVAAMAALYMPDFWAARQGWGCDAPDAIFILGMPRAGSTLIEQVLASHSQVEGTMELPDIPAMLARLEKEERGVETLSHDEVSALGQEYLDRTRIQRKSGKPFFIDKLPNNWLHTGFIHLILPNARIIDARRHPLACGFSNFKQHFARGQAFSYSLADMGRYYADYVALMAHFDDVIPQVVTRVIHEKLIEDSDAQIRALLDELGLPFEVACLRFWENDRAVRTASSEQVRQPIFKGGSDQWQPFEAWLGPMKQALGPVLAAYPAPPVAFLP
jgi:tetratricopeptide (TPR) repeat protein